MTNKTKIDPNVTLTAFLESAFRDKAKAKKHALDLIDWMKTNNCKPSWSEADEEHFYAFVAIWL
jgi:hypothetical protein